LIEDDLCYGACSIASLEYDTRTCREASDRDIVDELDRPGLTYIGIYTIILIQYSSRGFRLTIDLHRSFEYLRESKEYSA
jgi:hypothetical protein